MIKLEQPVIVEGKYDKITLCNVIDALIITTDGFGIFKNREKREMIKRLAKENGIIIMTDSDSAGNLIRAHIKNIVGDCEITNIYIPVIEGKEKRKAKASKEGSLGVEGMTAAVIEDAIKKSGITEKSRIKGSRKITKTDLYKAGLSGVTNAAEKRKNLLKKLSLPENLSPNAMLDLLNSLLTLEEFIKLTQE